MISRGTNSNTLEKSPLHVINATTSLVGPVIWSITCFCSLARNLLSTSNASIPLNCLINWRCTWESTVQKLMYKKHISFDMMNITFALHCFIYLFWQLSGCLGSKYIFNDFIHFMDIWPHDYKFISESELDNIMHDICQFFSWTKILANFFLRTKSTIFFPKSTISQCNRRKKIHRY